MVGFTWNNEISNNNEKNINEKKNHFRNAVYLITALRKTGDILHLVFFSFLIAFGMFFPLRFSN